MKEGEFFRVVLRTLTSILLNRPYYKTKKSGIVCLRDPKILRLYEGRTNYFRILQDWEGGGVTGDVIV